MAYASVEDVAARMTRELSAKEQAVCSVLLDDAAVLIDSINKEASADAKKTVSCRAVARMLGNGDDSGLPAGASQGSMSALGYSQSWSIGGGGAVGEMYITKAERRMLNAGDRIGSHSPVEDLCVEAMS